MSVTVELPRAGVPGSGAGGPWRVVVLNDDHNTFDHVAETLARVLPGVSLAEGYRSADQIHNQGVAVVWSGPREDVSPRLTASAFGRVRPYAPSRLLVRHADPSLSRPPSAAGWARLRRGLRSRSRPRLRRRGG